MKRWSPWLAAAALSLGAAVYFLAGGEELPTYGGLDSAEWAGRLEDADPKRRAAAAAELVAGGARATDVVVALFRERPLAITAERIAARIGPAAIPPLLRTLRRGDPALRRAAATLLGNVAYGQSEAVAALLSSLGDADQDVRIAAARALALVARPTPAVLAALEDRFRDDSPLVRHEAAWTHWRLARDPATVIPVFVAGLARSDSRVFRGAIALGEMGPQAVGAVPALGRLLTEKDPLVWSTAARVLFSIGKGAEPAVPRLMALLEAAPPAAPGYPPGEWDRLVTRMRLTVASAILVAQPRNGAAYRFLEGVRTGGDPVSRVTALRALWRADRERSRVLKDLPGLIEQPSSALSAARLAAEIGSPAVLSVPELTERLADLPWSPIPARALGAIGAPASSALPALRRAMASAPAAARVAAAWAVWRISSDAARPIDALSDVARLSGEADEEAAWSAVSTLAGLAAEEVAARECLERLSLDAPWPTRTAARRALDLLLQN